MTKYILLKSKDEYIDFDGNLYRTTKNGNVDDTDSRTLLQVNGNWWKGLSSSDSIIVNKIWRKFLKLND